MIARMHRYLQLKLRAIYGIVTTMTCKQSPSNTWRTTVRIPVRKSDTENRKKYLAMLRDVGAKVISEGHFGIDAEMDEQMISEALGLTVKWKNGDPRLVITSETDSDTEANMPTAYIPRKPEMF